MSRRDTATGFIYFVLVISLIIAPINLYAKNFELKRAVRPKPVYTTISTNLNSNQIILKFKEGISQPQLGANGFMKSASEWGNLNKIISYKGKILPVKQHFKQSKEKLDEMRQIGMKRSGIQLPDLSLYHRINLDESMTDDEKLETINALNELNIIETAYFPPIPELATIESQNRTSVMTPDFQAGQYYLEAAPTGVNAYYAWEVPGGRGENIRVIDIEGNWNETHEDLHGGIDSFHIAGERDTSQATLDHGTAVLGIMAADSNSFGMTGISYECDLGTVSAFPFGHEPTSVAINTAVANSVPGDVILIELHAPGPHFKFVAQPDRHGHVCMEYWQDVFDAILQASAMGRIIVEAAGNGYEDFDDTSIYDSLFYPSYRFSGALLIGASTKTHFPAWFTNYGQRVDVHGFGNYDVYSLAWGTLYGDNNDNFYTSTFSGTSSATPIIAGSCAVLQGINKANFGQVFDHNELRTLLTNFSTPQQTEPRHIGPLPDLQGSVDEIIGVSFSADTTFGYAPFDVQFSALSNLSVDTWKYSFGDGDSAFIQSPFHTYTDKGIYSVGIEIDAAGDIRQRSKTNYIISLADTIKANSAAVIPGDPFEIAVSLNNTVPAHVIEIPIEYIGDIPLSFDSFSTVGCRTDYFEEQSYNDFDTLNKRFSVTLTASNNGTSPNLPAGDGNILKLHFTTGTSVAVGDTTTIVTGGYIGNTSSIPRVESQFGNYGLSSSNSTITIDGCCFGFRGNVNNSPDDIITTTDLIFLIAFAFQGGDEPPCMDEADINASGGLIPVNVADIIFLVAYMFQGGAEPASCY